MWWMLLTALAQTAGTPGESFDFDGRVRPILEAACVDCHGAQRQRSGLRLDTRAGLLAGGAEGPVVVPGEPDASSLTIRVCSQDEDEVMPPKEDGRRLTPGNLATLRAWVAAGAVFPEGVALESSTRKQHWAFVAPQRPPVPDLNAAWVRNPIDAFVAARHQAAGLEPAEAADRATYIRRVSFDLVGLPPSVEAVDAFVADTRPLAYERLVDGLLASPHYGERWGRLWLDAARYADTDGYEKDNARNIWFYRDWVVKAFNDDMPYDAFVITQVAGDLLPHAGQDERVATGYLRNAMVNEEGGADPEQFRTEALFDRMDAIGTGILGISLRCAQCHSHKFDPVSHEEYFRLMAFLNNDDEALPTVYTPAQREDRRRVLAGIARIEDGLERERPQWRRDLRTWAAKVALAGVRWIPLQGAFLADSTAGQKFLLQDDGSFLAQGFAPTSASPAFETVPALRTITAFRLEALTDPNLPHGGPGRSEQGLFALSEFVVERGPAEAKQTPRLPFAYARADFEPPSDPLPLALRQGDEDVRRLGPASFAIDGSNDTAWGIDAGPGRRNVGHEILFVLATPLVLAPNERITVRLVQKHGGANADLTHNNNLGRFRLSVTDAAPALLMPLPPAVRAALGSARPSPEDEKVLFSFWRAQQKDWKEANQRIEALWRRHPEGTNSLTLQARPLPRTTRVFTRGEFAHPAQVVTPGVPAAFHPLPAGAPNRLAFARWLVDERSATTARVYVNRLWQALFGRGLVDTPEDFGTQAAPPTHPELLDWLAVEFKEGGWRQKRLLRLIVLSNTYRQSSRMKDERKVQVDPHNRLLARGPRVRLDGELVRDQQLASSGLLNPALGGPPVKPPAPAFLFEPPVSYARFPWVEATGPDRYRRALYTYRRRSTPHPFLQIFDTPNGNTACVRRERSNTPLQALALLNEPLSMESAQALALRMLEPSALDQEARLQIGFRRVLGRRAQAEELAALGALLNEQRERLRAGWLDAWQIAGGPAEAPHVPAHATPVDLAAYTLVARTLLNLDEAITKE